MPAKRTVLSRADLKALRAALEAKRAELLREHEENLSAGTHSEESFADPMDAAERTEEEAELLGLASQERALLSEIDHALAKIAKGTYGVSELSGSPIPLERLRALPWARFTADEEEEEESERHRK
jgi:DnaK suppressor protein